VTNKYLTTQALEWFDGVRQRFWDWLFDEQPRSRLTSIVGFVLGAVVARIEPDVLSCAETAAGALLLSLIIISFLIPVAYLIEWGIRRQPLSWCPSPEVFGHHEHRREAAGQPAKAKRAGGDGLALLETRWRGMWQEAKRGCPPHRRNSDNNCQ
jgi:hypothetical protein